MNTNQTEYLALEELVRRARAERSAALGEMIADGLLAIWRAMQRAAAIVKRAADSVGPAHRNQHAH
jgi:hypothetical protein